MGINWNYPTTMWIGENRIEDLSLACKELNISNPLFVTDKDLINLDFGSVKLPSPVTRVQIAHQDTICIAYIVEITKSAILDK